jgi:hypothetical protein
MPMPSAVAMLNEKVNDDCNEMVQNDGGKVSLEWYMRWH